MSKIDASIADLMEELGKLRGETVTIERLALETHLAQGTVRKWARGRVDRFDGDTMATFIDYFEAQLQRPITPNDVLKHTRN